MCASHPWLHGDRPSHRAGGNRWPLSSTSSGDLLPGEEAAVLVASFLTSPLQISGLEMLPGCWELQRSSDVMVFHACAFGAHRSPAGTSGVLLDTGPGKQGRFESELSQTGVCFANPSWSCGAGGVQSPEAPRCPDAPGFLSLYAVKVDTLNTAILNTDGM